MQTYIFILITLLTASSSIEAKTTDLKSSPLIIQAKKCNSLLSQPDTHLANKCFKNLSNRPGVKNDMLFYSHVLNNYASSLILSKQFDSAVTALEKAILIANNNAYKNLLPQLLGNNAIAYIHLKQYEKSYTSIKNNIKKSIEENFNVQLHLQYIDILTKLLISSNLDKKVISQQILHHLSSILGNKNTAVSFSARALINKADLYQYNNQLDDAKLLLLQALDQAQKNGLVKLIFKAQWKLARLFKKIGNYPQAIDYFSMSVKELQNSNIAASLESNSLLLNTQPVTDIYIEYADILLMTTSNINEPSRKQAYLQQARQAIESSKAADLQDFFKDECVANTRQKLKTLDNILSADSAVLYPVIFKNRLELLLSTNKGITQFTKNIDQNIIKKLVLDLRFHLEKRKSRSYLKPAQKLYDLIITPVEKILLENNISTLITIPSQGLHGLAFSALHDGKKFLIEKFALAISPGLELTDPRILPHSSTNILLGGISEPVQGFSALSYVQNELNNINRHYKSEILIDDKFTTSSFSSALLKNKLTIAHIATHGEFGNNVQQSFILAHDKKISVNKLAEYIGFNRFRDTPLELLTLSACYTAAGNEKAALGLAGITVKSGARSALATLWPVNDKATAILMEKFYGYLENNTSKAQSLRQSQLALIANIQYRHPGYWAPFILIGNWQ